MDILSFALFAPRSRNVPRLSALSLLAYNSLVFAFAFVTAMNQLIITFYIEVMSVSIGSVGMIQFIVRSIDMVFAVAVGTLSDGCATSIGKRKPFIITGIPCLLIGLLMLIQPPAHRGFEVAEPTQRDKMCNELQNCSIVRECIAAVVSESITTEALRDGRVMEHAGFEINLTVLWLFFSYALFSMFGVTASTIPYDALGQDLAKTSTERTRVFIAKGVSSFCGALFGIALSLIAATVYPTSLGDQMRLLTKWAFIFVGIGAFGTLVLVSESSAARKHKSQNAESMDAIQQVLSNRPFWEYLRLRAFLSVGFHLVFATLLNSFKYWLQEENSLQAVGIVQLFGMCMVVIYMRFVTYQLKRSSARVVWRRAAVVFGTFSTMFGFLPISILEQVTFLLPGYFSLLMATNVLLPNQLLAPTLDYAKLVSGEDHQGTHITFDVNLNQALDILVGSLPALVLAALGFHNNGGCSCGCGVDCSSPHLRWSCPGDMGYACSDALDPQNVPLFGVPDRVPPCLVQNDAVTFALRVMTFYVPTVCAMVAALLLTTMSMAEERAEEVKTQLARRLAGEACFDPIRNAPILHASSAKKTNVHLESPHQEKQEVVQEPEPEPESNSHRSTESWRWERLRKNLRMNINRIRNAQNPHGPAL